MKAWWLTLAPRERAVLTGGVTLLILLIAYFGVWEPLQTRHTALSEQLAAERAELRWMQEAAATLEAAPAARDDASPRPGSLVGAIDRAASETGLNAAVQRVQPDGDSAVRVWLEQAVFDDFLEWLDALTRQQGMTVGQLTLDQREPGIIDARVRLEGPTQ